MQVNGNGFYYLYSALNSNSNTIYGLPACTLVTVTVAAVNPCAMGPSSTVTAYTAVDSMSFSCMINFHSLLLTFELETIIDTLIWTCEALI